MSYVNLNRRFSSIDADRPYSERDWASYALGLPRGLGWDELLERPRVVVLAEASAGKSEEFRATRQRLVEGGHFAFYLTIETLAVSGFDGSLGKQDAQHLAAWRSQSSPAWFFLDSVDEARINHKDIETALNRFGRELGLAYDRARILLSCRGNVWAGEADLALVRRTLPVSQARPIEPLLDPDVALFELPERSRTTKPEPDSIPDVSVLVLTTLTHQQRIDFLNARGISDTTAFEAALYAHNLHQFAERPGDLQMLVRYWQKFGQFSALTEMTELGISERLAELGAARRTLSTFSEDQIRAGAERLAAALTLGRSMNLILPGRSLDQVDGINPYHVLSDWPSGEVDALLHRGLFVPATFGLIRFFHRSAQEYLTARWFVRIGSKLTDRELLRTFLAEQFGTLTIPPSLRAAAAWLAIWRPALRRELLDREPLILLLHGDPAKLRTDEKARLLSHFAERQASGDIAYTRIDHQALWMFAEPGLASAIATALSKNTRQDFRLEMLQLIEQGKITGCLPFLREAALDPVTRPYHRIYATRALRALNDDEGLQRAAADMLAAPETFGPELAPALAVALFPVALTVDELLLIIRATEPGREFHNDGFTDELEALFEACRSFDDRRRLVEGLSALAFEPPHEDWPVISKRHSKLFRHLGSVALAAIDENDRRPYGKPLTRLLTAVERAGRGRNDRQRPKLSESIAARPVLKQALFWEEIRRAITDEKAAPPNIVVRRFWSDYGLLWTLNEADRPWLDADLDRQDIGERRHALSALIFLARIGKQTAADLANLAIRVAHAPDLSGDVLAASGHVPESAEERKWRDYQAKSDAARAQEEQQRRDALRDFRARLQADSSTLTDPAHLSTKFGFRDLHSLTYWLTQREGMNQADSVRHWHRLRHAFSVEIAEAYRKGLSTLWRITVPEAPRKKANGQRSVKYMIILSHAGLVLEAEAKDWAAKLSPEHAKIATRHACIDDQGIPDWLGALLVHHPTQAIPPVAAEIAAEWRRNTDYFPLLSKLAHGLPIPPALRVAILSLTGAKRAMPPALIETVGRVLARIHLTDEEKARLLRTFAHRLTTARQTDDWKAVLGLMAILFLLDQEQAANHLFSLIAAERRRRHKSRAYELMVSLFNPHRGAIPTLEDLSAASLAHIVANAYRERGRPNRMENDGTDNPVHDDFNNAGGMPLRALIGRDGYEAYDQVMRLSRNPVVGESQHRLRELAYEMVERQSERPAWTADDVRTFEAEALAPIRTGPDLMKLTVALLDDIAESFTRDDMSAQQVVLTAQDEGAVQDWLGQTLNLRSRGRFHAHKESQIVHHDKPDILISSSSSPDEVAIEVKHGDKNWSLTDMRKALTDQLATRYLRPDNRRHGVLVISNHRGSRFWRDPNQKRRMSFADLIDFLNALAATITCNDTGPISVCVRGIDAAAKRGQSPDC